MEADGPFVSIKYPVDRCVSWTYTENYEIETINDKNESVYEYDYDHDLDRLVQVTYPAAQQGHAPYNVNGQVNYLIQRLDGEELGGLQVYRGTQLFYNSNGRIWASRLLTWRHNPDGTVNNNTLEYKSAMEYRYEGTFSRYMVRPRNPQTLGPMTDGNGQPLWETGRWSDEGEATDCTASVFRDSNGEVIDVTMDRERSYFASGQFDHGGTGFSLDHTNHLGTVERITGPSASLIQSSVYTAFGEQVYANGAGNKLYGYAGGYGYEASDWDSSYGACAGGGTTEVCDPLAALGWLHVGRRYYEPSSGRFMQRDPIGIRGGLNVFVYCHNNPVTFVDPTGLDCGGDFTIDEAWYARAFLSSTDFMFGLIGVDPDNQEALNVLSDGFQQVSDAAFIASGIAGLLEAGLAGSAVAAAEGEGVWVTRITQRQMVGRDGGTARYIKTSLDGKTVQVQQQVFVRGRNVHNDIKFTRPGAPMPPWGRVSPN